MFKIFGTKKFPQKSGCDADLPGLHSEIFGGRFLK